MQQSRNTNSVCACAHTHTHTHKNKGNIGPLKPEDQERDSLERPKTFRWQLLYFSQAPWKNHGPFSKGQEGSLDSHPHVIVVRHPTLLPARETERRHKESWDFHPKPATTSPLGPNHGYQQRYWWDAQTSTHISSRDAPLPIPAEMASWEASGRPPPLPTSARNRAPSCTQPASVEEQWGAPPPTSQEGIRGGGGKPGLSPLPSRKEELCNVPGVSTEVHRAIWVSTPTEEQSNAIRPLPVQCQRRPTKAGDFNKAQSPKT